MVFMCILLVIVIVIQSSVLLIVNQKRIKITKLFHVCRKDWEDAYTRASENFRKLEREYRVTNKRDLEIIALKKVLHDIEVAAYNAQLQL